MNSTRFSRAKVVDLISRIVPSSFFLFVVLLKFAELYTLVKTHQALGDPASPKFFVELLSRTSTMCFLALMTVMVFIRLEPIRKAKHLLPRIMAIAGTFFIALVTVLARSSSSSHRCSPIRCSGFSGSRVWRTDVRARRDGLSGRRVACPSSSGALFASSRACRRRAKSSAVDAVAIPGELSNGALLLLGNILLFAGTIGLVHATVMQSLRLVAREGNAGLYWPVVLGLCLAAIPTMMWRTRHASTEERRRVALLASGLVLGFAPTAIWVFLQGVWPVVAEVLPLRRAGWVVYPTLLSTPLTTAYSVLVRRALEVRVVVRQAMQYALARYSAITVAAIPVVLLAVTLYRNRNKSVAQLVSTPSMLLLGAVAIGGIVTLRRRSQVLARIDTWFFREQYDVRRILGQLVDRCRVAADLPATGRDSSHRDRSCAPSRFDQRTLSR